jgi:integrase
MSIRARGAKWHYRFQLKGKEYTGSTGLPVTQRNKIKAQKIELTLMRELQNGELRLAIQPASMKSAIEEFERLAEPRYRAHPSSFKRIHTSLMSAIYFFGAKLVSEVDAGAIEEFSLWRIVEGRVKDTTLRHDLYALSRFFATAIRRHWASNNPIREIEIPSDADAVRIHPLTMFEEQEYFSRARKRPDLYDVGRLIINQGMRPDEVTHLAKVDIDLSRRLIHVRNGKSSAARRLVPMTSESNGILERRMRADSNWIFPSPKDSSRPIGKINSTHNRVLAAARKEGVHLAFVPYDLRHTFATRAAQCGMDLPTLAALMGHNSIRCLRFYVHPMQDHKCQAMARFERSQLEMREEWLRVSELAG